MTSVRQVLHSASFYPTTAVYLGAVSAAAGVADHRLRLDIGFVLLSTLTIIVILSSVRREIATVHHLVNSQRDILVERIGQLVEAMITAGVDIPVDPEEAPSVTRVGKTRQRRR